MGKINWRFDRKTARRKFGHKSPHITPVKELASRNSETDE